MELTLLGTGAPEGLPAPDCPCAVCALATGEAARAATSVLVDGVVLLDLTPGVAFAAARAGRTLAGLRLVLLSHPHGGPPVEIPPGLPAPAREPDGERLSALTGHRVRAVPVDAPGTGYEVESPQGLRALYLPPGCAAAGPGALAGPPGPSALTGAGPGAAPVPSNPVPYDLVLLDVLGRPDALARLRAAGAVAGTTDVVAVHLGHGAPPEPELGRRLAALGARAVPDGTTLVAGDYSRVPDVPRRTLVLGGARSGKSAEAERRLAAFPDVLYAATGGERDGDDEWAARVAGHRARRPSGWRTAETRDLLPLLAGTAADPPLLIDCLSLWLTHVMDTADAWDDAAWKRRAERAVHAEVDALCAAWRATGRTVVAVSNEVGSGVVPATASGRRFRDTLGRLNAGVAAESEHVLLMVAGMPVRLR